MTIFSELVCMCEQLREYKSKGKAHSVPGS